MPNFWYLSGPVQNVETYNRMKFQEVIVNDESVGYISSYDDGNIQRHYCVSTTGQLIVLTGDISNKFTGKNIFISY